MRQPIDVLVTEAARRSARETPAAARMATVSAVNGDGTVDVAIADGEIPRVRCLTQIYRPGVGDVVEILATAGGWVCLGRLQTSAAPRIQTGTGVSADSTSWVTNTVAFPVPFASPPLVFTNVVAVSSGSQVTESCVSNVTTTGCQVRTRRSTGGAVTFMWLAVDFS